MTGNRKIRFSSERYIPGDQRYSVEPYTSQTCEVEVDPSNSHLEFTYRHEKNGFHTYNTRTYLYLELSQSSLLKALDFLSQDKPSSSGETVHIDIPCEQAILRHKHGRIDEKRDSQEYHLDVVRLHGAWNRLIVETFEHNPVIPYYTLEEGSEPQDRENLNRLQDFSDRVLSSLQDSAESSPQFPPIPDHVVNNLRSCKWGGEVLKHISDGDECLKVDLRHPALTSYIHAIEWAMIAYLEEEAGVDIIEKEKGGSYYNFAGGRNNILEELTDHADITQKTKSRIESMNAAERRWAAHHKSGDSTREEVESIRSRLEVLLARLFGEETSS